jgi:hypothetical protein
LKKLVVMVAVLESQVVFMGKPEGSKPFVICKAYMGG